MIKSYIHDRTFRKDCPFELTLRASDDGMSLVVKSLREEHNHEISKVNYTNKEQSYYYYIVHVDVISTITTSKKII